MTNPIQHTLDAIAGGVALATMVQLLPAIAAFMSIVWYAVRLWYFFKEKRDGNNIRNDNVDT